VAGTGIAIGSSIIQSYTDVVGCGLPAPAI
jgi:hypothetical protein